MNLAQVGTKEGLRELASESFPVNAMLNASDAEFDVLLARCAGRQEELMDAGRLLAEFVLNAATPTLVLPVELL